MGVHANEDGRTEGGEMKVVGYTALLYGKDYLAYAIRSIIDHIDEYHVLYSSIGAHGHRTSTPCPETRDELYAIAQSAAGDKLRWHDGEWPYEGAQRDSIYEYAPDADVIVVLDADEIWGVHPGFGNSLVEQAISTAQFNTEFRAFRVPIIHYWRSFYRVILHDPAYPVRVIMPKRQGGESYIPPVGYHQGGVIHHFGYAQRPEIVEYKILTHGHKGEWRKDIDWFKDRYMANAQIDCHPVGSEYWNPERVDPYDFMPRWMESHPFFHMGVIE